MKYCRTNDMHGPTVDSVFEEAVRMNMRELDRETLRLSDDLQTHNCVQQTYLDGNYQSISAIDS